MHASFWEEVDRSRQLSEAQRARCTLDLIDRTRSLNLAGIRMQFPEANDEEVQSIFVQRRALIKKLDMRL
jgi:hypothetical protein